jgi:hypothetical protein
MAPFHIARAMPTSMLLPIDPGSPGRDVGR